jgi:hypothetical protein
MGIDDTNDNVHVLLFELVRVFQHLIRFSDSRRSADVDTKFGSLVLFQQHCSPKYSLPRANRY